MFTTFGLLRATCLDARKSKNRKHPVYILGVDGRPRYLDGHRHAYESRDFAILLLGDVAPRAGQDLLVLEHPVEVVGEVLIQVGLILLDGQDIVGLLLAHLRGDLLLTTHGVDRDDRPGQLQDLQQLGDGGDLVALVVHRDLAQDQAVLGGPGADQVQRRQVAGRVEGAPQGLAVDRHDLPPGQLVEGPDPGDEAVVELAGIEQLEDAGEGVVGRDAIGELQEGLQPLALGPAVGGDLDGGLAAGDGAAEGDDEDIDQAMLLIPSLTAGVGQVAEVVQDRGRGGTGHARNSWVWIGDGPSSGRLVADSSVPEIPLAPLGQITQHSAMATWGRWIRDIDISNSLSGERMSDTLSGFWQVTAIRPGLSGWSETSPDSCQ